ncbi:lipopolysaccharide biosynthesis protein [uncultured Devosia sp.]|uniref:lipopolysaccharide biosynthesis protein n=1 Tax=uncultured Devosia sp. TaxID=211434 RepID=UPI0035CB3BD2
MLIIPADLSSLLRTGMTRSLSSLLIKVATAGLTYIAYVVLSRTMSGLEYGTFAIGLSLATVLAVLAGLGQQTAILRLWPEEIAAGHPDRAAAAIRSGASLTILASLATAILLIVTAAIGAAVTPITDGVLHLYACAVLILPLALAEYQSSALRAQGSLWTALVPRDLLWRTALPLAVLLLAGYGIALTGPQALLLAAGVLLVALAGQSLLARRQGRQLVPALRGVQAFWRQRGQLSRWFLYGAVIDAVALNADTLLVGLQLPPDAAATYFNASRTAGLMTLFTYAATLVIAPLLSGYFRAGDRRKAQAITTVSAWSGFAFSLGAFAVFALFGDRVLAIFGPGYADGWGVLLLLSFGLLFDAGTGSSRTTMMMTGHERAYVAIAGVATGLGLLAQVAIIPAYGLLGAAAANMMVRIATQLAIGLYCVARIGIDPTIFGVLRLARQPSAVRP